MFNSLQRTPALPDALIPALQMFYRVSCRPSDSCAWWCLAVCFLSAGHRAICVRRGRQTTQRTVGHLKGLTAKALKRCESEEINWRKEIKKKKSRRLQLSCTIHPVRCVGIYRRVSAEKQSCFHSWKTQFLIGKMGRSTTSAIIIISSWLSIITLKASCGTDLHIFGSYLRLQQSSLTWINDGKKVIITTENRYIFPSAHNLQQKHAVLA